MVETVATTRLGAGASLRCRLLLPAACGTDTDCGRTASANWALLAALYVVVGTWLAASAFSLRWGDALVPALAAAACSGLAVFYTLVRPDARLAVALVSVLHLTLFTSAGATLSYLVASTGGPLWDETFYHWDLALGLDWRAYLTFVDAWPALGVVLSLAYSSILPQMIIAVVALAFAGHLAHCRAFVLSLMLAGFATVLISGLTPAMAMFVHLGLGPDHYPNLQPAAAFVHVAHMEALRDGSLTVLPLSSAEGIITFPSYHAALALIFAVAMWPLRWLRWPALALNMAMLAATPIDGGHYFVDLIAGVAIAIGACLVAYRLPAPIQPLRGARTGG